MIMTEREWIVNPNRSALGPDVPGQNGHFRAVSPAAPRREIEPFKARIKLAQQWSRFADADGTVTFTGDSWRFVIGVARIFIRSEVGADVPPPFGYQDRGKWFWWDGTTTDESILDGPQAMDYVREYLELMFPGASIELSDER